MRIALERRCPPPLRPRLLHVITPRTNAAAITSAVNLLGTLRAAEPFSLELAADDGMRWFLARAGSPAAAARLAEQLAAAYPQAGIEPLDTDAFPALDPAVRRPDEQARTCALVLREPEYLPLRTVTDAEVAAEPAAQADPVLGLLAALGGLPPGWRALSQLVLAPAPRNWARQHARRALEDPVARERNSGGGGLGPPLAAALLFLALAVAGPTLLRWYWARDWLRLGGATCAACAAVVAAVWLANHVFRREPDDPRLVREKLGPPAFRAQLRLTVFAPVDAPAAAVEERLRALAGAYGQFDLAAGNGLMDRTLPVDGDGLLAPRPVGRAVSLLNVRELAGMWHLPQGAAEARFTPRRTARRRVPLPCAVADGCPIGVERDLGRVVPIAVSERLLGKHMLLVAKTGRGKSTLMLRLAEHLMTAGDRAVMVVDPHRDLAEAVLGRVPAGREDDVVYLDVGAADRPFGLNLLDVGLGWSRAKAVDNAIQIFQREFDRFWGPRMEDAFVHALATLYEANTQRRREEQFTLLDVPPLLTDGAFRLAVLKAHAVGGNIEAWWTDYFQRLDPKLQLEIVNPVLTKIHRYSGNEYARRIVGQPRSTIDPAEWLAAGRLVVVNTNKATVGENTAALVGATLLNLAALAVGAQARLDEAERRRLTLLVDEFQCMPGADYEAILSELAKYRANIVLATQSLARLEALDREHQRSLKAMVFSNIDALFAFHVSAEDARYLVDELDPEQVGVQDLVSLGEHRCYARLSAPGPERLEVCSVELAAPEPPDPERRRRVVRGSADRYGRPLPDVESDLDRALQRVRDCHASRATDKQAEAGQQPETGRQPGGEQPGAAQPTAAEADGEDLFPAAGGDGGPSAGQSDIGGTPTSAADDAPPRHDEGRGGEAAGGAAPAPRPGGQSGGGAAARPPTRADRKLPRHWWRNRRAAPDGAEQTTYLDADGSARDEAAE